MRKLIVIFFLNVFLLSDYIPAQHEKLLPDSTVAAFSILDNRQFFKSGPGTGLKKLFNDPEFREFTEEAFQDENGPFGIAARTRCIKEFAAGQVTLAWMKFGNRNAQCLMFDCADAGAAAQCVRELLRDNETNALTKVGKTGVTVILSESPELLQDRNGKRLGNSIGFSNTVLKSKRHFKSPTFWLYLDPWSLVDERIISNSKKLQIAINEGADSIKAFGGCGSSDDSNKSNLNFKGEVFAETPFKSGMRLLDLRNQKMNDPPAWLSQGVSSGYLNLKTEKLATSFASVFDNLFAEGEEGVFEAVLNDLKNDRNGPRVDVENQILGNLISPACFSTDEVGERTETLTGIEVKDRKEIREALVRFYKGDSQARKLESSLTAWKVEPLESVGSESGQPYVVALSDTHLFIAPTIKRIETALSSEKEYTAPFDLTNQNCLGYRLDMLKHAKSRHQKLKSGSNDGFLNLFFQQKDWSDRKRNEFIKSLPPFDELAEYFDARLNLTGRSTESGWAIRATIAK